ncbi:MAG: hypothetical protein QW815_05315 [Nitrososphaerota archaeon]
MPNTWLHYVGGKYTPTRFVHEAAQYGFSRRIPFHLLKSLSWGDTILFASWKGSNTFKSGKAEIFCQGHITRISIEDPETMTILQQELEQSGKIISASEAKQLIRRACGYYYAGGSIKVSASVHEIYTIITTKCPNKPPVMIMGPITAVFNPPKTINAPFTRSLIRIHTPQSTTIDIHAEKGDIVTISEHIVAKKKDDFAIPLALPPPAKK